MLMNSIEFWLMNNPVRGFVQKRLEAPRLKSLCDGPTDAVLEIGCGQGVGAGLVCELLNPGRYVGVDLDRRMIRRARKRGRKLDNASFIEGDAAKLPLRDRAFDVVVDFGIIHHIPNWPDALSEIDRTLKPGGTFLFEELSVETWQSGVGRPLKRLLEHPYDDMFTQTEFQTGLQDLGFELDTRADSIASFRYFWGRARKSS